MLLAVMQPYKACVGIARLVWVLFKNVELKFQRTKKTELVTLMKDHGSCNIHNVDCMLRGLCSI
jgi:hypothetical protein